jgi:hypothetical protein
MKILSFRPDENRSFGRREVAAGSIQSITGWHCADKTRPQACIDSILCDAVVVQSDHEVRAPDGSKVSHTITDHEALEQDLVWEAGEIIRCIGDMKD